ncbi:hypothetical protein BC833DRAFT_611232, partial [Globomyces pollinis-pini]
PVISTPSVISTPCAESSTPVYTAAAAISTPCAETAAPAIITPGYGYTSPVVTPGYNQALAAIETPGYSSYGKTSDTQYANVISSSHRSTGVAGMLMITLLSLIL